MKRFKCQKCQQIVPEDQTYAGESGGRGHSHCWGSVEPIPDMSAAQENHLAGIKDRFCIQVDAKYRTGAAEHGGNLWDKTALELIDEAIQETVDQYTFLHTLRMQVVEALAAAKGELG